MTGIPEHIQAYWTAFLRSPAGLGCCDAHFYETFRIGADAADADAGAALILGGDKTATSSLLWEYELSRRSPPSEGCLSVLENGRGAPVCVVRTTRVEILPFRDVDVQFARDYGEGDRTLDGWRQTFRAYYARACAEIGREMSEDTPLVCERFRVIYR